jgi:hypothetical protein
VRGVQEAMSAAALRKWTVEDEQYLRANYLAKSIPELVEVMRRSQRAIISKASLLGVAKTSRWRPAEIQQLKAVYGTAGSDGVLGLSALAKQLGRDKANVCRKAKELGLVTSPNRRRVHERKVRLPKYQDDESRRIGSSAARREWIRVNGHPRGALGLRHSAKVKAVIAEKSRQRWENMTKAERDAQVNHALRMRAAVGSIAPKVSRGSWKAGWREVGGRRIYFRSRWEANYAFYLEWLKSLKQIADWEHEPHTFWFEGVRRGCVSYLPDFKITNLDSSHEWHEVKGWMDARSKTVLARMAKYFPSEKIVLIAEKQYKAIRRKAVAIVPGWEDSARDRR